MAPGLIGALGVEEECLVVDFRGLGGDHYSWILLEGIDEFDGSSSEKFPTFGEVIKKFGEYHFAGVDGDAG